MSRLGWAWLLAGIAGTAASGPESPGGARVFPPDRWPPIVQSVVPPSSTTPKASSSALAAPPSTSSSSTSSTPSDDSSGDNRFGGGPMSERYWIPLAAPGPVDGRELEPQPGEVEPEWAKDWFLSLRTGVGYLDLPGGSRVGAASSAYGSVQLADALYVGGSFGKNLFEGGSQIYLSFGLHKRTSAATGASIDRIGYQLFADYVHDSRFSDLDAVRLRAGLSLRLDDQTQAGVVYFEPWGGGSTLPAFSGRPDDPVIGRFARGVHGYLVHDFGIAALLASVGYNDEPATAAYGGRVSVPLTDNWSTFASASYEQAGFWTSFSGVEFKFGPRRRFGQATIGRAGGATATLVNNPSGYWGHAYGKCLSGPGGAAACSFLQDLLVGSERFAAAGSIVDDDVDRITPFAWMAPDANGFFSLAR